MSFNLEGLSLHQMMQLRIQLNESIAEIEKKAHEELLGGNPVKGFKLQKGKTSRIIANAKGYRLVLQDAFTENYEKLCVTHSVLPLTKAEALIKKEFDGDDATEILGQLAKTLGSKTSAAKLVYTGGEE